MHDVKIKSDQKKRSLEKAKQKKASEREIEGLKGQYANSLRSLDSEERKHAGCTVANMAPTKDTVLITGGTGFVASYCILQAIQAGYTVHATLRSRDRIDRIRQSLQNGGATWPQVKNVKFFEADLLKDEGWETACQGCGYVLHLATPVPKADPKDENDLIIPAREGTLRVLRAAKKVGTVKRFVFTSSATAVIGGHDVKPAGQTWNEEDWTDLENHRITVTSYAKSKTLAERAARDFIKKEGNGMQLAAVLPHLVLGPILSSDIPSSVELPMLLLNGKFPGFPHLPIGVADVRDVADLHLRAMTYPDATGQRFIATSDEEVVWVQDMVDMLKQNLPEAETKKLPTRALPNLLLKVVGFFDASTRLIVPYLGNPMPLSNAKAKNVLGWQPGTAKDALLASAESLKKYGKV
ncbi:hypothetical protein CBER1_09570 [Cercospora berteroae]|uniref:NAD-dependent epimerase/dehydratase domain-containing protein n=1 Tax=Cercospora berteroae TaxID=357750 RepID=A0A2S6BWN0_9PEZI|nr:hypothetical protein CBER1_09570 [Cercospora berteroae]